MPKTDVVKRINEELTGEPIPAGAYTLRPVARLHARVEAPKQESADLAWGYARLEPVALIVDSSDGAVLRIAINTPDDQATKRLVWVGALVAAVSAAAIVVRRLTR
jgi:hypothetical protein